MNEKGKTKYFFMSDLHGIHPSVIVSKLDEKGFDINNKNHKVVVAGDFCDGLGKEKGLIDYFMMLDKKNKLIAVKGNHDYGGHLCDYQHLNKTSITQNQIKGLDELPYQIDTKHFYLAHGMYIHDRVCDNRENASIWCSPVLLQTKAEDGWGVDIHDIYNIKSKYSSIDKYCKMFDKDIYLGHFGKETLDEFCNVDGMKYKNITGLDTSVINSNGKSFDIFVKEY